MGTPATTLDFQQGPSSESQDVPYERRLATDVRWALDQSSKYFMGQSDLQQALRKICRRLDALNISYAVIGGLALMRHGYVRLTDDVDILVTRQDLTTIHERLTGLGYLRIPEKTGRNLRDTEYRIKIEFLVTGEFPGDGKVKPVAFPDPAAVAAEHDGIRYLNLDTLVELKLASGITNPGRIRDLADVLELIKALALPRDFSEKLDPFVRAKFDELWSVAQVADDE